MDLGSLIIPLIIIILYLEISSLLFQVMMPINLQQGTLFLDPLSEKVEMEGESFYAYVTYPKVEEVMTYFTKDSFHEPINLKLKI